MSHHDFARSSTPGVTRRTFLASGAVAVAGSIFDPFTRRAQGMSAHAPLVLPTTRDARKLPPSAFLPEPPSAERLRQLAVIAMEAAKAAGADFADVRIGMQRTISVVALPYPPGARLNIGYGVRARVNGTWGFQHGNVLSPDAVAATARGAVAGARRYAAANQRLGYTDATALAPASVVTGEWHGPNEIDPFAVPLDDYYRVLDTITQSTIGVYRNVRVGNGPLKWTAETRVFASTEGSLVTQYTMRGGPWVQGAVTRPDTGDGAAMAVEQRWITSGGFEVALVTDWVSYLMTGVEEARKLSELSFRPFRDVGRFPVIFDGASFGSLIGMTVSQAVDADRASGVEADASGGTFLAPPDEILGASAPQFSPLLNVHVDRALPYLNAVGWDDEGIAPEPYTIVDHGRVVDYHTTRTTAPMFADWYAKRGRPLRAHGGAVSPSPTNLPSCTPGHVYVEPATTPVSIEDLAREIQHGFILKGAIAGVESGLTLAMTGGIALEVQRGKIVGTTQLTFQLATKKFLSGNLVALGGPDTRWTSMVETSHGVPPLAIESPVTAPAVLCKDVDVVTWLN